MAQYATGNPGVTIVVPVLNRAERLLDTLRTIPEGYPLIVVDNGSSDGTAQMAADYCRQRPGARYAEEHTPGAAAARNRGLALCATEWIYFFDSDDEFTSLPSVDAATLAAHDMICFPVRLTVNGRERVRDYSPTDDVATHTLNTMLNTISMLFRAEWLRAIGGWDNRCRIWDDWELGIRALMHRPRLLWKTGSPCHHVDVHDASITGASYSSRWGFIRDTLDVVRAEVEASGDERLRRAFDLRCYIVSGKLRHEGDASAAATLSSTLRPSLCGRVLACYTALGGRGAWRLALGWLNLRHAR